MRDHQFYERPKPLLPIESHNLTITEKQLKYIEILKDSLEMSVQTRNAHIASIVKRPCTDIRALSRSEASQVIEKFKEWKEAKK